MIGRRTLLLGASALVLGSAVMPHLATPGWASAPDGSSASDAFMKVSAALTGEARPPADLGAAIYSGLKAVTPDFDRLVAALPDYMTNGVLHADVPPANKAVAAAIVKGWYLGIVGEGAQAHVVAYEHALNYAQVSDVVVLPTYARGEPHYWAKPPVIVQK